MTENRIRSGTIMFSEDWFNQCMDIHGIDKKLIPDFVAKAACNICEGFQAGDSYAPVFVLSILRDLPYDERILIE